MQHQHADGARTALGGSLPDTGTCWDHPVSQVTGQVSRFPLPWHQRHRKPVPSPAAGSQARSQTHRHVVPAGHAGIGILPVQPTSVKIHLWEWQ